MPRFRTDPKVEAEGVWLEMEHVRVKLARAGENNRLFKEYMTAEAKKVETAVRVGMLSNETAAKMLRGAYAETVIRDWETVTDEKDKDGNPIFKRGVELLRNDEFVIVEPSPAAYAEYLADPANFDTFKAFRDFASSGSAYVEIRKGEAKN